MELQKKKILIVTAKWPYVSDSTDGGDSTLSEIVEAVSNEYIVDVLCFRDDQVNGKSIKDVRRVIFYHDDFAMFQNYSLHNQEKFMIRLEQAKIAFREIKKICNEYDLIVVQHVMFVLGMKEDVKLLNKIVLYPMFTGTSYIKSGENVPQMYLNAEKAVLNKIKKIFTPSEMEKEMLVSEYGVLPQNIFVIPRQVKYKYIFKAWSNKMPVQLLYIASIRIQKNHLAAMKLVKILLEQQTDVILNCVGPIQDTSIYNECISYINSNGIRDHVIFHGNKSQLEVGKIISSCDINISVSNWETFGRGIYEGMTAGLPTIVFDDLACIKNAYNIGVYPCMVKDIDEMAKTVINLIHNKEFYENESKKGKKLEEILSEKKVQRLNRAYYRELLN